MPKGKETAKKWLLEVETRSVEEETGGRKGQLEVENDQVGPGKGRKYPLAAPRCRFEN